jgi:hypothetical protein
VLEEGGLGGPSGGEGERGLQLPAVVAQQSPVVALVSQPLLGHAPLLASSREAQHLPVGGHNPGHCCGVAVRGSIQQRLVPWLRGALALLAGPSIEEALESTGQAAACHSCMSGREQASTDTLCRDVLELAWHIHVLEELQGGEGGGGGEAERGGGRGGGGEGECKCSADWQESAKGGEAILSLSGCQCTAPLSPEPQRSSFHPQCSQ